MAILDHSFLAHLHELSLINYDDTVDSVSKLQGIDDQLVLIVDCNALLIDIENKIVTVHNFIRDKYRSKFPELEALVLHPIDYARVVKKIGNEMDLTLVDLRGLLPSAMIMVVSVTASTTNGKPLQEDVLSCIIDACDRVLAIDSAKKKVLDFVERRMGYISALVGSGVAAKLMGTAGGLSALARMNPSTVGLLGDKKNNLAAAGFSTLQLRVGYVEQTEIFESTPPSLRMRAARLLAAKSVLAARVDSIRGDPSGKTGTSFRVEIREKIEKWQEPPSARQPEPLPIPHDSESHKKKKKRGGRRLRKMKERYGITETRKEVNRMAFGVVAEESSLGDGLGHGYGMLGCYAPKRFKKANSYGAKDMSMEKRPLTDFQDARMKGDVNGIDFESILQIAVLCVASSSTSRPTIDLVFEELERVWRNTQAEMIVRKERTLSAASTPSKSAELIYV